MTDMAEDLIYKRTEQYNKVETITKRSKWRRWKRIQGRSLNFEVEAFFFLVELRKFRLYRERKRREAAAPRRTYSSPPFCPCAPFCTAP